MINAYSSGASDPARKADPMSSEFARVIEQAKSVTMSATDREEQRESFVYGNTHIENAGITRDLVHEIAETMRANGER